MGCNDIFLVVNANLFNSLAISWSRSTYERADVFAQYVESGCESDKFEGFEVINRVVNPEGASGWAIVKASDHKAVWKWCQPWCKGFGNDVEVIPVLTDSEYLAVHKELD